MLVQWDRLLIALGCEFETATAPYPCPMHPHTEPSLYVITDSGISTFICAHCKFNGDAIALVTKARGLKSPSEAMQLFLTGNELCHTLQSALSETQLQSYLNGRRSQELIRQYVHRCHNALSTVPGQRLMSSIARGTCLYHRLPETLGLLLTSQVPAGLSRLERGNYKHDIYALYAYEYDNNVTALTIRAVNRQFRETIALTPEEKGVYMESSLPQDPKYIIVAQDEELATELYAVGEYYKALPYPVVAIRGYPLAYKYRTLQNIYLLSTGATPLTLVTAIRILTAPQLIAGVTYRPEISVIATTDDIIDPAILMDVRKVAVRLETWIAQQLYEYHHIYGMADTYKLLHQLPPFQEYIETITTILQQLQAPEELIKGINQHQPTYDKYVILSSNVYVYRTVNGYLAADNAEEEPTQKLSNFTFDVKQVLYDTKLATLLYRCTVKPENAQPLDITIPSSDFITRGMLRRTILAAYLNAGHPFTVITCVTCSDISWAEIRDRFIDPKVTTPLPIVKTLGVSTNLTLELPHLTIAEHGTKLIMQNQVPSLHPSWQLYEGIRPFVWGQGNLKPFATLWKMTRAEAAGMAACISHIAFCIATNMAHRKLETQPDKQHLLLVNTKTSLWEPVLRQLTILLSGTDNVLRAQCRPNWFKTYNDLGDFPLVFDYPATPILLRQKHTLENAALNWIATVNAKFAATLDEYDNVIYMQFTHDKDASVEPLPNELILDLQSAFPEFLQCVINQTWDLPVAAYVSSINPTLDMCKFIGNMIDSPITDTIYSLIRRRYKKPVNLRILPHSNNTAAVVTG